MQCTADTNLRKVKNRTYILILSFKTTKLLVRKAVLLSVSAQKTILALTSDHLTPTIYEPHYTLPEKAMV